MPNNTLTIECSADDLEILLAGARETGDCLLILHDTDGDPVCLRVRHRKPGRPRRTQSAAAALAPPESEPTEAVAGMRRGGGA